MQRCREGGMTSNEVGVLHPAITESGGAGERGTPKSQSFSKQSKNSKNLVDYTENSKYSESNVGSLNLPYCCG